MIKKFYLLSKLQDWLDLRAFRRESQRNGKSLFEAAQKVISNYVLQEKQNGYPVTDSIKTGIYAYHFNYANQALDRLAKVPEDQKVLGNELQDIHISDDFVREMAPSLTEWDRLHYLQYGTRIHDLSGEAIGPVKASISGVYLTSWMGLTYQKFKEQFKPLDRILSTPAFIDPIGPVMAYRRNMVSGLEYYFFNPNSLTSHERE